MKRSLELSRRYEAFASIWSFRVEAGVSGIDWQYWRSCQIISRSAARRVRASMSPSPAATACLAGGKAERIRPCLHPIEPGAHSSLGECATLFRFPCEDRATLLGFSARLLGFPALGSRLPGFLDFWFSPLSTREVRDYNPSIFAFWIPFGLPSMIFFQHLSRWSGWLSAILLGCLDASYLLSLPEGGTIAFAPAALGLVLQLAAIGLLANMWRLAAIWLGADIGKKINWFPLLLAFAVPALVLGATGSSLVRSAVHGNAASMSDIPSR